MIYLAICVLVVVVACGLYFFQIRFRSKFRRADHSDVARTPQKPYLSAQLATTRPDGELPRPPSRPWRPIPGRLREFRFLRLPEAPPDKVQDIAAKLRTIPRPPAALHKLVSAEFLSRATSTELADIVMSEPEVAVKVLAVANSPLYGLQQLVGDLDQAVKFLGMNTVRTICLQYLLNDTTAAGNPETKKVFERLWNESALACELCFKLAQLLKLEEPGSFVTQIVLSYLGRQATYSLLDPADVITLVTLGLLDRSVFEQDRLGLASAEIGALLMKEWGLPKNLINVVKEIDETMVSPVGQASTSRRTRNALCYLCCRLAEDLVNGKCTDIGAFDILNRDSLEYFHLHAYLDLPSLAPSAELIHSPEITSPINRMLRTMLGR